MTFAVTVDRDSCQGAGERPTYLLMLQCFLYLLAVMFFVAFLLSLSIIVGSSIYWFLWKAGQTHPTTLQSIIIECEYLTYIVKQNEARTMPLPQNPFFTAVTSISLTSSPVFL